MNGEWGFCDFCAFLLPVNDGVLVRHDWHRGASRDCNGSGQSPGVQPGPEARAREIVNLRKSARLMELRKEWLRKRDEALEG